MRCAGRFALVAVFCATSAFAQTKKPAAKTPQFGHWGPSGYHLIRKVPIPGNNSWDKVEFDPIRRRLFLAHGTHVVIVNPYLGKVVGDIPNTLGVHDVAFAPELHRGFISDGQTNDIAIFDSRTLKIIARTPTADGPDVIVYDASTKRVFTMNPRSNTATAIDAATGRGLGDIALGGEPAEAVSDRAGHIYINLENTSEELELDAKSLTILHRWPMSPCQTPKALSIDPKRRILFAGCGNDKMGIMNADTGAVLAAPAAGSGSGTGAFDPQTQYAFSANADGTLTIVIEADNERFNVVENVETEHGARSMALDPKIHEVFLVTSDFEPLPPNASPHTPQKMIPGTTHILVFARDYLYK